MAETGERRRTSIGSAEFIFAQILAIISTIVGVYLAGYVGFQRTLEYDALQNARERLGVLEALHAELGQNVDLVDAHLERMRATQDGQPLYGDWPRLRLYLWGAAAESPALFEAPPATIAEMQAFYAELDDILSDEALREKYRRITSSNAYERNQTDARLAELLARARDDLSPELEAAMAEPRGIVETYRAQLEE